MEPRGGQKQKAQWASEQHTSPAAEQKSYLATYLIDRWSWGSMSTPQVQQVAWAAVADGASHADLVFLSKLGTSGRYPGNMFQELTKKLQPTPMVDVIDTFHVWQKKNNRPPVWVCQNLLLPHRVFSCLYKHHYAVFKDNILGGSVGEPARFWTALETSDV